MKQPEHYWGYFEPISIELIEQFLYSLLHFLRPSRKNQNHLFLLESLFRSPNSCDLLCQAFARLDPQQSHYWPDDADADATTPADGWPTLTCYRDAERTWATLGLDLVTTLGHAALTDGLLGLALQMGHVVQHVFTASRTVGKLV